MYQDEGIQKQRRQDREMEMKKENIVSRVSDRIMKECGLYPNRVYDVDRQTKGIDFVLDTDEDRFYVDEKDANSCWDRDLQTYTIEVINKCNNRDSGWTMNKIAKTTHYLLVWLRATDKSLQHIWRWEGMFVEKRLIQDILSSIGYTNLELEALVQKKGSECGKYGLVYTLYEDERSNAKERVNVFLALGHLEKNVNLQLPKEWFKSFATRHIVWEEDKGIILNEEREPDITPRMRAAFSKIRNEKDSVMESVSTEEPVSA